MDCNISGNIYESNPIGSDLAKGLAIVPKQLVDQKHDVFTH